MSEEIKYRTFGDGYRVRAKPITYEELKPRRSENNRPVPRHWAFEHYGTYFGFEDDEILEMIALLTEIQGKIQCG